MGVQGGGASVIGEVRFDPGCVDEAGCGGPLLAWLYAVCGTERLDLCMGLGLTVHYIAVGVGVRSVRYSAVGVNGACVVLRNKPWLSR